jgi:glycosyltransferase involved in cell wall biosynthesis
VRMTSESRFPVVAPLTSGPARTRVLLISLFHPELIRGGAQQICYELFEGLREEPDIEPYLLASIDASYPSLYKSGARITGFDNRPNEFLFLSADYDHLWHKTGSPLHVEAFVEFLETVRPDVVHFHHFLTLGIDFITLTRRTLPSCRIVFTFHEFLSICDAHGHMVRTKDKSLCTQASSVRCHQCFPDRTPEHFMMRKSWFMRHLAVADAYTCPSHFMIEHYVNWGLPRQKISHVTNGQRNYGAVARIAPTAGPKNRFGFFGQLVDAKGVHIILRAVNILRGEGFSDFALYLNGDNLRFAGESVRKEIEEFLAAEDQRSPEMRNVFFNGSYQVDQLASRMAQVDWCLVPSIWWEIFGLVISEAWMFGKPVICSSVGGPAERIQHDIDGLHFQMGDPRALAYAIRRACSEEGLWERLVASLPEPPRREKMVAGYREIYRLNALQGELQGVARALTG